MPKNQELASLEKINPSKETKVATVQEIATKN